MKKIYYSVPLSSKDEQVTLLMCLLMIRNVQKPKEAKLDTSYGFFFPIHPLNKFIKEKFQHCSTASSHLVSAFHRCRSQELNRDFPIMSVLSLGF